MLKYHFLPKLFTLAPFEHRFGFVSTISSVWMPLLFFSGGKGSQLKQWDMIRLKCQYFEFWKHLTTLFLRNISG